MRTVVTPIPVSELRPTVIAIRHHTALARSLLEELDRAVPLPGINAGPDALGEQCIEELTRLACRLLEFTGRMTVATVGPAESRQRQVRR